MPKRKLKQRKDGRYEIKIYLGLDEERKRKYQTIYGNTVSEVQAKEREIRAMLSKGLDIATADDTYSQWLKRAKNTKKIELNDSEYKTFSSRAEYFEKTIGDVPIHDIKPQLIQPIINEIFERNPATGKPSAKRTIERYLNTASSVFEYAIENRAIDFNPCKYVKIPKQAKTTERRALSHEERKWIEEFHHRAQPAAMLMMYSGLRRGEATALLWSDIDFDNKTITVNKSYDFKSCELKKPKTAAGIRVVSIPDKLVNYLKTLERKSIYVITTAHGKIMTDQAWKVLWDSYLIDLNQKYGKVIDQRSKFHPKGQIITIQPFTPHCLRHTFCTIMYEANIDVLTAKEQMGHSDIKTTLAIYTHLDKNHKIKSIDKMNDYLSEKTG